MKHENNLPIPAFIVVAPQNPWNVASLPSTSLKKLNIIANLVSVEIRQAFWAHFNTQRNSLEVLKNITKGVMRKICHAQRLEGGVIEKQVYA